MENSLEVIRQLLPAPSTFNIILTLLIIFQWYKQHAKEQSIKNNLFAIRRTLEPVLNPEATIEFIDATLASLGSRRPFIEKLKETQEYIKCKFVVESKKKIAELKQSKKSKN